MKMQRLSALTKKNLKQVLREPASLFMVILFPLVLSLAFGAAFGAIGSGNGNQTYKIGVVNHDTSGWSTNFIGNLTASEVLVVQNFDTDQAAQETLQNGQLSAVIIIPADFGTGIDSYFAHTTDPSMWTNTSLQLSVDQGSLVAKAAIPPVIQQVLISTMFGTTATTFISPISISTPTLVAASTLTQFDVMAPGILAFAAIFLTMIVAQNLVGEREKGLLRRISVTPTTSGEVIGSHLLSNVLLGMLQLALVLVITVIMGFHPMGGVLEILFALLIMAVFAICNVGFGLIVGSIAKNGGSATGISFLIILPQMFLGSFVPAPQAVAMFVPSYYVTDSITSLFLRGASVTSPVVWTNFGIVCLFAAVIVTLGIVLYGKFGKK